MPLISFIIPLYNLPLPLLEECVDSILCLPLNEWEREIIFVDDGSKESLNSQLRSKYGDKINYIRQQNGGPGAARNTGIDHANGKYIQFIDGDDRLVPQLYTAILEKLRNAKPDMIIFDWTSDGSTAMPVEWSQTITGAAYMNRNNLRAVVWASIFKKDILHNLRFTPHIYHEDEEFTTLLVLQADTLLYTTARAYFYRLRSESITTARNNSHTEKRLNDMEMVIFKLKNVAEHLKGEKKTGVQRKVAQLTMDYIFNVARLTKSLATLEQRICRLHKSQLFPLPKKSYTQKYTLFRIIINYKMGRLLLLLGVRFYKHQR